MKILFNIMSAVAGVITFIAIVLMAFSFKNNDVILIQIGFPIAMVFGLTMTAMFNWIENKTNQKFVIVMGIIHFIIAMVAFIGLLIGLFRSEMIIIQYCLPNFIISGLIFTAIVGETD